MNSLTHTAPAALAVLPAIELVHGQPMVSSLKVAEHFGKQHKNVLRDIKTLDCSPEFNRRNFEPVEYVDAKGEVRPAVTMTRDGFVFLVMGYTGQAAARLKEAYIARFNELEQKGRLSAAELSHYRRCERELIRTMRQCIGLQRRVIRLQNRLLPPTRRFQPGSPGESPQGQLFGKGGAA
jgi:Rha family phage regulatory protein